jgi:hypothetical protein
MIGLCVGLAGVIWAEVPVGGFTLAWQQSVEKVRWEEYYRVTPTGLVLEAARIRGPGAGMKPPDGAELRGQLALPAPAATLAATAVGAHPRGG